MVAIKKVLKIGVIFIILASGLLLFYAFNPIEQSFFIPCPFHYLTGLHCPGCGSQRALHQLVHFNMYEAFRYNPLLVLSLPILIYSVGITLYNFINQTKYRVSFFYKNTFIYTYFGIVVAFWILRNIPIEPFSYLAPTTL
ncbi:DUF2752 domain-containing protein [Marixanthomonas ophiurae]|uniref:DUF2752 domain-containing protein n=1 Tax=Marixanthomonas ophiurae TaxID=387659 RepID=A0A3E1QB09_9FLAO|nr:DUF2752 domain-containing protein [Marixanthomonas ophiurae]